MSTNVLKRLAARTLAAATEAGERFLRPVQQAFIVLSAATKKIPGRRAAGVLSVSVSPSFASRWLVPRLGSLWLAGEEATFNRAEAKLFGSWLIDEMNVATSAT